MNKRDIGQEILEGIREIKENKLIAKCREVIECDTARISKPGGKLFLIIGFNRNTKDDPGQWCSDALGMEPIPDWDYVEEKVVASGKTEKELIESAEEYKRLCGMTIFEYLTEETNEEKKDSHA
jgi:hypothetical protein